MADLFLSDLSDSDLVTLHEKLHTVDPDPAAVEAHHLVAIELTARDLPLAEDDWASMVVEVQKTADMAVSDALIDIPADVAESVLLELGDHDYVNKTTILTFNGFTYKFDPVAKHLHGLHDQSSHGSWAHEMGGSVSSQAIANVHDRLSAKLIASAYTEGYESGKGMAPRSRKMSLIEARKQLAVAHDEYMGAGGGFHKPNRYETSAAVEAFRMMTLVGKIDALNGKSARYKAPKNPATEADIPISVTGMMGDPYTQIMKHLQGQHDQSTHGNRNGGGSEFKPNNLTGGEPRKLPNGQDWSDLKGAQDADNHRLVMASSLALQQLEPENLGEVFSTEDEIANYMDSVFERYGYGKRSYSLNVDNPALPVDAEAAVARGMTETMSDSSPYKNAEIPVLLYRSQGVSKFVLLHEIAHILEGDWTDAARTSSGHGNTWFNTWRFLLRNEGLSKSASMLDFLSYSQNDNGVFTHA